MIQYAPLIGDHRMNGARSFPFVGVALVLTACSAMTEQKTQGAAGTIAADCVAQPTTACVAAHAFALARTLPEDDRLRARFERAERTLAPQNLGVALDFVLADEDGTHSWKDPDGTYAVWDGPRVDKRIWSWIDSGQLDAAILLARSYDRELSRAAALVEAAHGALSQARRELAAALLDEAEVALIRADVTLNLGPSFADAIERAATAWIELDRVERARRLLSLPGSPVAEKLRLVLGSRWAGWWAPKPFVDRVLGLANSYPAHARALIALAWDYAGIADNAEAWLGLARAETAHDRPDRAAEAIRRALSAKADQPADNAIATAATLVEMGRHDEAAALLSPWREWLAPRTVLRPDNRNAGRTRETLVEKLVPVFAALGQDDAMREAILTIGEPGMRVWLLDKGSKEHFRLGHAARAIELESEAIRIAAEFDLASQYGYLDGLAQARAARGDIAGALDLISRIAPDPRRLDRLASIARVAQNNGHTNALLVETLAAEARARTDLSRMVETAESARRGRLDALGRKIVDDAWALLGSSALTDEKDARAFGELLVLEWEMRHGSFGPHWDDLAHASAPFRRRALAAVRQGLLLYGRGPGGALPVLAEFDDEPVMRSLDLAEIAVQIGQKAATPAATRPAAPVRQVFSDRTDGSLRRVIRHFREEG
jgi:tetratricopeptide (TPR) repeat protein